MNAENARQCLTDIGCSQDRINRLAELMEAGRLTEAKQRLRCPGHVFFPCDRQKIAQRSDFHFALLEMPNQNIMIFIITISEDSCKVL